jgi:hypothetical protein
MSPTHGCSAAQASATFLFLTSLVFSQVAAEHPQDAAASSTAATLPQLVDITESTRIKFNHLSSPEQKYIVESMSGGVAPIDYTFTDVSKKAGVDDPQNRFGLTAAWTDFDEDGRIDLFVTNDGQPTK